MCAPTAGPAPPHSCHPLPPLPSTLAQVRLQKQLVELEKQFYGSAMAYDGAMGGKEDLARALLRNVYMGDEGKAPSAVLLATYVRRCFGSAALCT